jgi:hypothetical protein
MEDKTVQEIAAMQHYGVSLKPDAAIRLMDSMVHLILANDEAFERGGEYD